MAQPKPYSSNTAPDMYPPKGAWALEHAHPPKGSWELHLPADSTLSTRPPAILLQLVLAALVLVVIPNLQALLSKAGVPQPAALRYFVVVLAVLAPIGAAALLGTRTAAGLARGLGLAWNGWRGPLLSLLASAPCWVGFALVAPVSDDWSSTLVLGALLIPFTDELIYRGFGFVYTRRALRWYLLLALLVQALTYCSANVLALPLARGVDADELETAMVVPCMSALLYAILDMLGGYTLWCGWIWRASVTAAATVFATEVLDLDAVVILTPVASALAAILLLWLFVPRRKAQ